MQQDFQRAIGEHQRGQLEQAEAGYRAIVQAQPGHFAAAHMLGLLLLQRGLLEQALPWYERAISLKPDLVQALLDRAWLLHRLGRLEAALQACRQTLAAAPGARQAQVNLGLVLHDLGRYEEAIAAYDQALRLQEDTPQVHFFRGNALVACCRPEDAIAAFDRAIGLSPEFDDAFRNRGTTRLSLGDFAGGFPDYEHRRPRDPARRQLPGLQAPDWRGEDLHGRSILVSDASGLGDVLQFCRYLPMLAARGAQVSFIGNPRLFRLLSTLDAPLRLLSTLDPGEHFDFHSKLLSLPGAFGTTVQSIPADIPYLRAEPERVARWGAWLGGQGFRIGICWRGNPSHTGIETGRSLPLAAFAPLARIPGVRLVSLQKKFGLDELAGLPADMRVEMPGEEFDAGGDAFLDSAALMQHLDLVISPDTSPTHVAGATGRPVWLALQQVPDWRWLRQRRDTPWYPQARLFRQASRGDWQGVFDRMESELVTRVAAWRDAASA